LLGWRPEPQLIIMKDSFKIELPWYLEPQRRYTKSRTTKLQLHRCTLKHCKNCNSVWQYDYSNNRKKFINYEDMPTYGLIKKTCDKCKKKEGYLYENR